MAHQPTRQSKTLRGLSPMIPEPSPRRSRINPTSGSQSVALGTSRIDPLVGVIDSQDRPSTSRELERNTPVLS